MTKEKKELSPLAKQLLSGSGAVDLFTQSEFDDALAIGKAEIMKVAIDTTKTAIRIERSECAKIVREWVGEFDLETIAKAIDDRLASQVTQ
jgi:peptide subunit release factor 1 (eRF1)